MVGARDSPRQPADLDSAARARVRLDARRRPRASARPRRPGASSPSTTRATWTARSSWRRCRRGGATALAPAMAKEFFKAHFFPAEHGRARVVHQLPELLPRGRCSSTPFRCRSGKRARGRRCATSANCSKTAISVLIFPEGRRTDTGEIDAFRPGHRHDRVAAGRAGRAGPDRGARSRAAPRAGGWRAPAASGSPSARRCAWSATTTKRSRNRSKTRSGAL